MTNYLKSKSKDHGFKSKKYETLRKFRRRRARRLTRTESHGRPLVAVCSDFHVPRSKSIYPLGKVYESFIITSSKKFPSMSNSVEVEPLKKRFIPAPRARVIGSPTGVVK